MTVSLQRIIEIKEIDQVTNGGQYENQNRRTKSNQTPLKRISRGYHFFTFRH